MEPVQATTSRNPVAEPDDTLRIKKDLKGGKFCCSFCNLEENYDYKGAKPPFAKSIQYLEDCYLIKDPFSLPNKGEVLVLGGDCNVCNKPVCLACSIYFRHRFCSVCALDNITNFPAQLHGKIKNLKKEETQLTDEKK